MIKANDVAFRRTAKWPDARSVAAEGTKLQGTAADKHDASQNIKTAGVKAQRNRRYDNNESFVCSKQRHKQWDCPQSQHSKAVKGVHGQSHGYAPKQQQQQQSTSGPAQHTWSKATGTAPASATLTVGASGYKIASNVVVTGIEPAVPVVSTQEDDDYVYVRVQRQKVTPVDIGRTETVQHHVSQSAGSQNATPVLQSAPVQLPTPASRQWLGYFNAILYMRVSVLQPGGSADTSVDTVETEPHLEVLTQHVAARLAVPGASAPVDVQVLIDSGSGITAMSK